MNFGLTTVSIAPLRTAPRHDSLMISQLLFGEQFSIIHRRKEWLHVYCEQDGVEAWVDEKQTTTLSANEVENLEKSKLTFSFDVFNTGISKEEHIPIVIGSKLHHFDGLSFKLGKHKIIYNGQVVTPKTEPNFLLTEKICLKYLNSPSLAGGKSPFGIDSSGLVQMVYKLIGISIPRQIEQQQETGSTLSFLSEAKDGDLLFCENEQGKKHVGIYLSGSRIAHCYGKVKMDAIDSHGIFDAQTNQYSHRLIGLRRIR